MMFEMSDNARFVTVYNYLSSTCEFIGSGDAYIAPSTGLPAYCTDIAPPKMKKGYVCVFNEISSKWGYQADHRGKTAFFIDTAQSVVIDTLGELSPELTFLVPSEFDVWDGSQWVKNTAEESKHFTLEAENEKQCLFIHAVSQIETLQDAVDLDMATTEEAAALLAWKKYRVALNRVDPTLAPDIEWPEVPA